MSPLHRDLVMALWTWLKLDEMSRSAHTATLNVYFGLF